MDRQTLGGLLFLFGVGFLVANLRIVADFLRFRRVRTSALLIWQGARPRFYLFSLALAVVLGGLLFFRLFVQRRPPDQLFGEAMMFVYFGYALPLSTRGKSRSAPWCHFPQRIARPAFQRAIKGAILGWEDAKFSFTALGREPAPGLPHARLIGVPRHGRGRVRLPLCSVDGSEDPIVSRRTKQAFRRAKKLGWGAAIERADELRD